MLLRLASAIMNGSRKASSRNKCSTPEVVTTRRSKRKNSPEELVGKDIEEKRNKNDKSRPTDFIKDLKEVFKQNGETKKEQFMVKYMKNKFPAYGLYAPERRQLQSKFMIKPDDRNEMYEVLKLCWSDNYREIQYFGIDYAVKYLKIFSGANASDGEESLQICYFLISTKSCWDTVDLLSSKVVGHLIKTYSNLQPKMDDWCADENMWIRRASVLYQLNYNKNTDSEILFRYCKTLADEKDFFIRKALGWALRNYGRFQGKIVKDFVTENKDILSNLTIREALKNIK